MKISDPIHVSNLQGLSYLFPAHCVKFTVNHFQATVTHTDNDDKDNVNLVWIPPKGDAAGTEYYFHYTIVKSYDNIWVGRDSEKFSLQTNKTCIQIWLKNCYCIKSQRD